MMIQDVKEKIRKGVERSEFDAVISVGPDNVQYLSNVNLPFLYSFPDRPVIVLWPKNHDPCIICPVEWGKSVENSGWIEEVFTYEDGKRGQAQAIMKLVERIKSTVDRDARISVEYNRISNTMYSILHEELTGYKLVDCGSWLRELRMVKTGDEVDLLEEVSHRVDHGIVGAAHHIIVTHTKTEMAFAEDIRVHCIERLLDTVGHHSMSQVASGEHATKFWSLTDRYAVGWEKMLLEDEIVRMSMTSSLDGYWSDASRILVMGEPNEEQARAFQGIVKLREKALQTIRPGVKCSEVYLELLQESERVGVNLISEMALGHGVGKTSHEPPYIVEDDETELQPGMVLVLDPVVLGPKDEILRSKDTILVTETGCRILGWYVNWRAPYIAAYNL